MEIGLAERMDYNWYNVEKKQLMTLCFYYHQLLQIKFNL